MLLIIIIAMQLLCISFSCNSDHESGIVISTTLLALLLIISVAVSTVIILYIVKSKAKVKAEFNTLANQTSRNNKGSSQYSS